MRRILTLIVVSVLIMASLIWPAKPALAAGITLFPASGAPGSIVTITGTGFGNNESGIYVVFDNVIVASGITAAGTSWTMNFAVPANATVGIHQVSAAGTVTTTPVSANFEVIPTAAITINPASGTVGTSVAVSGTGFAANESGIKVMFGGASVITGRTANAQGSWSGTFSVPAAASGSHTVNASGNVTQAANVTSLTFNVEPLIAINKTSGAAGTPVTVTGTGFVSNETGIRVTYDGVIVASNIRANEKGGWTANFNIPASPGGSHIINASGSSTQAASVPDLVLTTGSSISINKNNGPAGTSVIVTGTGFAANESGISITFDGLPLATATANAQGSWTATIVIPESPGAGHVIDAYGPITQADNVPDVTFTTGGGISISPTGGAPGTAVTVNGFGFAANEKGIAVTYNGTVVASNITANAQGQWTGTFTVPASSAGSHIIDAYGASTRAASIADVSFTIGAGISINKTSGAPGTTVTVNGFGFAANEKGITVTFNDIEVASNITANAQGAWAATFAVPPSMSGSHRIDARGAITTAGRISDLAFSTTAGISASPISGNVGTKVTISGFGFAPNVPLKIKYDNVDIAGLSAYSDSTGEIQQVITIPKSASGQHGIKVVDPQNNEYKIEFTMESIPPSSPRLLSPGDGSRTGFLKGSDVTFRWNAVSDPSGVTYVLQVNDDLDFQQPLLEKSNLNSTSYTPTSSESLKEGTYYWRVKAVDGASNESEWSQTWVVQSGTMALWALILIILAGILLIGTGVYFFLGRKRGRTVAAATTVEPSPFPVSGSERIETIPGQWRTIDPELPAKPRSLPFRLALPQAPKGPKTVSPEDQARMKVIANFAQSLPLVETTHDPGWLIDLIESGINMPLTPSGHTQFLEGSISARYDPAWIRHPLYEDMSILLKDHPIMQNLRGFVDAVNLCAYESGLLLREIHHDTKAEISPDLLKTNDWDFVSAIYTDAMSWFSGKSLMDPSERDYTAKPGIENEEGNGIIWLWGNESTSFDHPLISATNEEEFARFRGMHMRLRRSYRNSSRARQIASIITQLEVQRSRLLSSFSQFASAMQ